MMEPTCYAMLHEDEARRCAPGHRVTLSPGHIPEAIEWDGQVYVTNEWDDPNEDGSINYYLMSMDTFTPRAEDVEEL